MATVTSNTIYVDQRARDPLTLNLTVEALGTSKFAQRVRVRSKGTPTREDELTLRNEMETILRTAAGSRARLAGGYTIGEEGGELEAEAVTRHAFLPDQNWEVAVSLGPLTLIAIEDVAGLDPMHVASRMLRAPLSATAKPEAEQRAEIKKHLRRHGGLWIPYRGQFITDSKGFPISGIQEGRRRAAARRASLSDEN